MSFLGMKVFTSFFLHDFIACRLFLLDWDCRVIWMQVNCSPVVMLITLLSLYEFYYCVFLCKCNADFGLHLVDFYFHSLDMASVCAQCSF